MPMLGMLMGVLSRVLSSAEWHRADSRYNAKVHYMSDEWLRDYKRRDR